MNRGLPISQVPTQWVGTFMACDSPLEETPRPQPYYGDGTTMCSHLVALFKLNCHFISHTLHSYTTTIDACPQLVMLMHVHSLNFNFDLLVASFKLCWEVVSYWTVWISSVNVLSITYTWVLHVRTVWISSVNVFFFCYISIKLDSIELCFSFETMWVEN